MKRAFFRAGQIGSLILLFLLFMVVLIAAIPFIIALLILVRPMNYFNSKLIKPIDSNIVDEYFDSRRTIH